MLRRTQFLLADPQRLIYFHNVFSVIKDEYVSFISRLGHRTTTLSRRFNVGLTLFIVL